MRQGDPVIAQLVLPQQVSAGSQSREIDGPATRSCRVSDKRLERKPLVA
jgi:hypothetical protein